MVKRLRRIWTEAETALLRAFIASGGSAPRAAAKFKRTEQSVRAQANTLGLKFPTIRALRAKASGSSPADN